MRNTGGVDSVRGWWRRSVAALAAVTGVVMTTACGPVQTASADRFRASGELIAWSGGDAGAAYACFSCHGVDGRGDGAGTPRLAGLDAGYLVRQLAAYADGRRRHPPMAHVAERLTDAERRAVAQHYAGLRWAAGDRRAIADAVPADGPPALWTDGDAGRGLAACADCHGTDGEGRGSAAPPLAGQPAPYQAQQLHAWRRGERRTDADAAMLRISQRLAPDEAAALAAYAAALAGSAPAHPVPRAPSPPAPRRGPRSDASAPRPHARQ